MRGVRTTRALLAQARAAASRSIRTQPWKPAGGPLIGPAAEELDTKNGVAQQSPSSASSSSSSSVLRLLDRLSAAQNAGNGTDPLLERRQVCEGGFAWSEGEGCVHTHNAQRSICFDFSQALAEVE
jgi:hypothetical protein